uniref:Uncharacterized protein n=1 Tax=Oryza nivara TaxID=4536 RepID=A0A0E0FMN3_ORYNI
MDGRRRRSGRPDVSYGNSDGIAHNRSVILGTIHGYYKEALAVLPLDDLPELAPRLVGAGVCFGFGDPTTNIIANTFSSFLPDKPDPDHRAKSTSARQASRRHRQQQGRMPPATPPPLRRRHEPSPSDRWRASSPSSHLTSATSPPGMRSATCASPTPTSSSPSASSSLIAATTPRMNASSARQPDVDDFIAGSFSLASHLEFVTQTVLADRSYVLSVEKILLLSGMLKKKPRMLDKSDNPMIFADERRLRNCHTDANASGDANCEKVPGGLTISLRAVLLDKIHAKYLKAISRLPMQDVRARYHRALVNGGYCYGPFSCVTNIIVNTLWYDSTFPAVEKLEVDMICTSTFVRVESRSLRGLIKLLLTCIPEISEHDAMIYLLKNNLKVAKQLKWQERKGGNPAGMSVPTRLQRMHRFILSPKLMYSFPLNLYLRKIEAALRKKGYLYDLQVICVANERVGSQMNFLDFKSPYSHVNFLARPKVGSGLKLFFAEFSNDDDDVSFCCTVSRKSKHGTRIMHPAHPIENYCGGDMDFTEMAHGTHELTNARIISCGKCAGNRVGMCGDDYIYFDPTRDAKFAQCMNRTASRANISWSDILKAAMCGFHSKFQKLTQITKSTFRLHEAAMESINLLIVDDAAKINECDLIIPLRLPVTHILMLGDDFNLQPSKVRENARFTMSPFKRLLNLGFRKHMLTEQYAIHPSIWQFRNEKFYEGRITNGATVISPEYNKKFKGLKFPNYCFIDVTGTDGSSCKEKNTIELATIQYMLEIISKQYYKDLNLRLEDTEVIDVGVLCLCGSNISEIKSSLRQKYASHNKINVHIESADSFQGETYQVVILSMLFKDENTILQIEKINAAITKARHCLWMFGEAASVSARGGVFRELVDDMIERKCILKWNTIATSQSKYALESDDFHGSSSASSNETIHQVASNFRIKSQPQLPIKKDQEIKTVFNTVKNGKLPVAHFRMSENFFSLRPGEIGHYDYQKPYLHPVSSLLASHAVMIIGSAMTMTEVNKRRENSALSI